MPSTANSNGRQGASSPIAVSVLSPFFAHYRAPLFELLDSDPRFTFTWYGNTVDYADSGIPGLDANVLSHYIPTRTLRLPKGLAWQSRLLAHAVRTTDSVAVYTGDAHNLSTWMSAAILRLRGKRVVFWTHGWKSPDQGLKRIVRQRFYKLANGLMLYGAHAQRLALANGFAPSSVFVVRNSLGAPIGDFSQSQTVTHDRQRTQNWIVITRLVEGRDLEAVLHQVARLKRDGREIRLTVVGDGPMLSLLENLATALEVDVRFLGAVYEAATTARLLSEADVCMSPGTVGLNIIHSMSSGCPVVTHDDPNSQAPEFDALRDGHTGITFPRGDFEEMADRAWRFVADVSRAQVVANCHAEIRAGWTPARQSELITHALRRVTDRSA